MTLVIEFHQSIGVSELKNEQSGATSFQRSWPLFASTHTDKQVKFTGGADYFHDLRDARGPNDC